MGLYIKGLQKPKSCIECYFSGFTKGKGTVCLIDGTRLTALLDENMTAKYVRASVCPLIPIPDHGDLIDREALNATDSWEWIRHQAPVVIPAERSE